MAHWSWVALQHGHVLSQQQAPQLPTAPRLHMPCVLVVPAAALSWHWVSLPPKTLGQGSPWLKGKPARLRSVLEGLLEDQVLDEPAQLHFALQPQPPEGRPLWLAVCQRDWLHSTLDQLRTAGYSVEGVIPELAPAADPASSQAWLCGDQDSAHWLWSDTSGVHQRPWQAHQAAPWTQGLVSAIDSVQAEAAVADMAASSLGQAPAIQSHAQRLAQQLAHNQWNLAQFDFALASSWHKRLQSGLRHGWQAPQWRPARWALLALLAIQLLGLQLYVWRSQSVLQQQRTAIHQVLTDTFPRTPVIVDAPAQMRKAVQDLQQSSGQVNTGDLENLLSAWGHALQQAPGIQAHYHPASLRYSPGLLEISTQQALAPDAALQQTLRNHGLDAQFQGNSVQLRPTRPMPPTPATP